MGVFSGPEIATSGLIFSFDQSNTDISDETREWLDIKVGKLYIKVGRLIDKLYVNKQKSYEHWQNNYQNVTTN